MHSYQSRWEELFTNQQGQVMTNFKLDNWVIMPNDPDKRSLAQVKETYTESNKGKLYWPSEDSAAVCSEMTHYELWQPQRGEWCWFWGIFDLVPKLAQFIDVHSKGYHAKTFSANDSSYYSNVEPFIGQLPTILKDNT